MSNSQVPMNSISVLDPRTNLNQPKMMIIEQGGEQVSYQVIQAQNPQSTSSSTFNILPPDINTIIDKRTYLRVTGTLTFNATAVPGVKILNEGYDSFRAFPLQNTQTNVQCQINNGAVNFQPEVYLDPLLRIHNNLNNQQYNLSLCPSALDNTAVYNDLLGTVLNPLGTFKDSTPSLYQRGSFQGISNVVNVAGASSASLAFDITEPLMLSPFIATQEHDHPGLTGVRSMILTINWSNNLSRMWSHNNALITISSINVAFTNVELYVAYITPKYTLQPSPINQYNYTNVEYYNTGAISLADGATYQASLNNIQLQQIPNKIMLFARKSDQTRTYNDPDSYLQITSINITYMNRTGILGTARQEQLYQISKRNKLNMTYNDFSGKVLTTVEGDNLHTCGSIIVLDPAFDFGLPSDYTNGLSIQNQLQVNVTIKNNTGATMDAVCYLVTLTEGVLTIQDTNVVTQLGVITKEDVMKSSSQPYLDYNDLEFADSSYQGGSLKSFFTQKVGPWLKDNWKPMLKAAIPIVTKMVGLGAGGCEPNRYQGGSKNEEKKEINKKVGGKGISRSELKMLLSKNKS